ncbi:MAG TPA: hypothetical protein VFH56_05850 [Acidimicrobiales bacterium]|nr:hypothetical protein [Acidimicrobiales bacterium]
MAQAWRVVLEGWMIEARVLSPLAVGDRATFAVELRLEDYDEVTAASQEVYRGLPIRRLAEIGGRTIVDVGVSAFMVNRPSASPLTEGSRLSAVTLMVADLQFHRQRKEEHLSVTQDWRICKIEEVTAQNADGWRYVDVSATVQPDESAASHLYILTCEVVPAS